MAVVELFLKGILVERTGRRLEADSLWASVDVEPSLGVARATSAAVVLDVDEAGAGGWPPPGWEERLEARLRRLGIAVGEASGRRDEVVVYAKRWFGGLRRQCSGTVWVGMVPFVGGWIMAGGLPGEGGPCPWCFYARAARGASAESLLLEGREAAPVAPVYQEALMDAFPGFLMELLCERPREGLVWRRQGPLVTNQGYFGVSRYCGVCGPGEPLAEFDGTIGAVVDVPGERAAEFLVRTRNAVNAVTGVVRWVEDIRYGWDINSEWAQSAVGVRSNGNLADGRYGSYYSSGKGRSRWGARAGAVAEAIEFDALRFDASRCVRSSYRAMQDLGSRAYGPHELLPLSERQWNAGGGEAAVELYRVPVPLRFEERCWADPLWWMDGRRVGDWSRAWFPASYVFTAEIVDVPEGGYEGGRYFHGVHSGAATGPTRVDALCRGLCELVERDAVALWWYGRVVRPVVELECFGDPWLMQAQERFEGAGREIRVFDITTVKTLPAVVAVSFLRQRNAYGFDVVLSGGCSGSLQLACRRAVSENVQHIHASGGNFVYHSVRFDTRFARVWAELDVREERWLSQGCAPLGYADEALRGALEGEAFLLRCKTATAALGVDWYAVDLSAEDHGVAVMRSIAPGLLTLFPLLGSERMYSGWKKAGWDEGCRNEDEVNPIPYVF